MAASSSSDAWAVGHYTACYPSCGPASVKTIMMHWNGTGWTRS